MAQRGHKVATQKSLPVVYKSVRLEVGYRLDLHVDEMAIVEVKAIDQLVPIHRAQLLAYLALSGCKLGLLITFNTHMVKDGIERVVNGLEEKSPRPQRAPRQTACALTRSSSVAG